MTEASAETSGSAHGAEMHSQQRKVEMPKIMGDMLSHLADYICESIENQVKAEVADLRARLDRMEALFFHADATKIAAIDQVVSAATQLSSTTKAIAHTVPQRTIRKHRRGRSPTEIISVVHEEHAAFADATCGISVPSQAPHPETNPAPDGLVAMHGLWASSLGCVVIVDELGCRFNDNDGLYPLTVDKAGLHVRDWTSRAIGDNRMTWTQQNTGDTSLWHRLSHCPSGKWAPVSHSAQTGDIVRVDADIVVVMEFGGEAIRLHEGLGGKVVEIDSDGDWLVDFPSLDVSDTMKWVLKSNLSHLRVFTAITK